MNIDGISEQYGTTLCWDFFFDVKYGRNHIYGRKVDATLSRAHDAVLKLISSLPESYKHGHLFLDNRFTGIKVVHYIRQVLKCGGLPRL